MKDFGVHTKPHLGRSRGHAPTAHLSWYQNNSEIRFVFILDRDVSRPTSWATSIHDGTSVCAVSYYVCYEHNSLINTCHYWDIAGTGLLFSFYQRSWAYDDALIARLTNTICACEEPVSHIPLVYVDSSCQIAISFSYHRSCLVLDSYRFVGNLRFFRRSERSSKRICCTCNRNCSPFCICIAKFQDS